MTSSLAFGPIRRTALALALAVLAAAPAAAQNAGCILDNCADRRPVQPSRQAPPQPSDRGYDSYRPRPRGASQPGDFDFYVFSLSWSAGFCETGGADKNPQQCSGGQHLGFVVHGLWPQYERGFPQDCGGGRMPSRIALDQANGLFPDIGLARYEWRKHGTCSGKSPGDYFADVRAARAAVAVPQQFANAAGDQTMAPIDILRAFEAANPRLRPGMSAVGCRQGVLQEVRFCMTRDLRDFRPCPEVAQQTCRTRQITVPAPL
ncbi:MAG: ribonuclease T2 [Hyphomicrobiales bacterium]|nr:ribonuclease T2 [Hyphomicrobiales bacterium]